MAIHLRRCVRHLRFALQTKRSKRPGAGRSRSPWHDMIVALATLPAFAVCRTAATCDGTGLLDEDISFMQIVRNATNASPVSIAPELAEGDVSLHAARHVAVDTSVAAAPSWPAHIAPTSGGGNAAGAVNSLLLTEVIELPAFAKDKAVVSVPVALITTIALLLLFVAVVSFVFWFCMLASSLACSYEFSPPRYILDLQARAKAIRAPWRPVNRGRSLQSAMREDVSTVHYSDDAGHGF
mmetsp:Transcript_38746/g.106735  ORF Transcript_38746/g.106735 Transcript_38746/m.106735 type:complete len:239 (+) Transcript_38746:61-777(+)